MDTVLENVIANSVDTDQMTAGDVLVKGAARFLNPIYAELKNSEDINQVSTGSISNNVYVLFTNGTNLFKVRYSDLIADLSTKVSIAIADSGGVGY